MRPMKALATIALLLLFRCVGTYSADFTIIHSFAGGIYDGNRPNNSLVTDGSVFYGTTGNGGTYNKGTIYTINPDGSGFSLLRSFSGSVDDGAGQGELTLTGSTLYGTTGDGGAFNKGVIYKMNTNGTDFILLHSFS